MELGQKIKEKKAPNGYVKTEIGIVPNDWKLTPIGDILKFKGGSQPDRSVFRFYPKKEYIRLLQIRDYKSDKYASYIPNKLARRFCEVDDIMIGRYGPPVFQILQGMNGAYNVALIKAIPQNNTTRDFAWYVLKDEKLFDFVEKLSQRSSGQTGVDLAKLKEYIIPLPPLKEQMAIAEALSNTDALITSVTAQVEKKRQIKEGAMRQLLTPPERGGVRLKGFNGDWELKKLGELTSTTAGGTPNTNTAEYWGGEIPWMSSGELNNKYITKVKGRITKEGLEKSATKMIPKHCVLIGLAGQGKTRGTAAINFIELCTNQSIAAVFPSDRFDSKFMYFNIDSRYDELRELSTGDGGRGGLNLKILNSLIIHLPPLKEQIAIARILSDMDTEIQELEAKRKKYELIKVGMMRDLLTGKVRLI